MMRVQSFFLVVFFVVVAFFLQNIPVERDFLLKQFIPSG